MDSEEPIHIPNEDTGQENKPRTTKLEHRETNIENYPEMTERVMPKAKDVS